MKIKLRWCVRHSTAGRYVFCEGVSPLGSVFLICHFVSWEKRLPPWSVVEHMRNTAFANCKVWDRVINLLEEATRNENDET